MRSRFYALAQDPVRSHCWMKNIKKNVWWSKFFYDWEFHSKFTSYVEKWSFDADDDAAAADDDDVVCINEMLF